MSNNDDEFRISELKKEILTITIKLEDLKTEREKKFIELTTIYGDRVCPICGKLRAEEDKNVVQ